MRRRNCTLILTCEHGGRSIPGWLRGRCDPPVNVLDSHRGWDPGVLELARRLSKALGATLHAGLVTRLAIDLNRSLGTASLFSKYSRDLDERARMRLVREIYLPYRTAVERDASAAAKSSDVVHVSVHTFTPVLRGERRDVDVGLLFDAARPAELALCRTWRTEMVRLRPRLRVAFNRPYKGTDDGFTTYLRTRIADPSYAGIELEVNQRFPRRGGKAWLSLQFDIVTSLQNAMTRLGSVRT